MYLRTTRVVYCLGGKVGSACDVFEDNEGGILSGRQVGSACDVFEDNEGGIVC